MPTKVEISHDVLMPMIEYCKQKGSTLDDAVNDLLRHAMLIFSYGESNGIDRCQKAINDK